MDSVISQLRFLFHPARALSLALTVLLRFHP
jgi:hypothetical protein